MAKTASSGGTSADRIKTDTAFERTWENMAVFSRAGKAAKLLRTIFRDVTRPVFKRDLKKVNHYPHSPRI